MATGKAAEGPLYPVKGVRSATVRAGIRYPDRRDLVLIELAADTRVAGVFTRNAFCAAPVIVAREHLESMQGIGRYFLMNAGNANAGTGDSGLADARYCCEAVAQQTGVRAAEVLPFSTGVIGERLPVEKLVKGVREAVPALSDDADAWWDAAAGIMTTDTRPKAYSRQVEIDGQTVTLTGLCKGSGMVRPDMATMLAYVFTDAGMELSDLQSILNSSVEHSFNRITVDGDTSTNDCCMLAATGQSGVHLTPRDEQQWRVFSKALHELTQTMAVSVIRDAEGASKFVTIEVFEGADAQECLDVAYTIAESPLVKTALTASDPNWGRILAAVGRAGLTHLDISRVQIHLDDVCIVENGALAADYTEEAGQEVMNREDITVTIRLDRGQAHETVWTADLSEEYVRINASYRS